MAKCAEGQAGGHKSLAALLATAMQCRDWAGCEDINGVKYW